MVAAVTLPLLLGLALASSPHAGAPPAPKEALPPAVLAPGQPLRFDWMRDGLLAGGGAVLWLSAETWMKPLLSAERCRWCDRDGATGEDALNPLDSLGLGMGAMGLGRPAQEWSDRLGYVAVPLTTLGLQTVLASRTGDWGQVAEDTLMVAEAVVLSGLVTHSVKFAVARERPWAYRLTAEERATLPRSSDRNMSFFSGHTSFAFAAVVATATVAELRGREGRWLLWAAGLPLAATVSVLRMAADRHFLTDVLVGATVGAAVGWAVPVLLHPRGSGEAAPLELRVSASPEHVALSGTF
ncbi:MAG: phosphatase PAP2 family protein [Myxococcaceae bacterium]|nr:phosphatase PAP2 family protein [Myxococcaceae bacterium]MCI0669820.1 phosphatase PAP2 family protein [Myxococcaceae bacterium]